MSEPEAKRPRLTTKLYDNESMYQKCHNALINQTDVQFIFEGVNGITKVPAKKAVLVASSSVFNAMFNDFNVKIVDASSEAFTEFLQFFHDNQVQLTMDNIAEVLKLIDKYDVNDCIPICVDFLKDHLEIDDILWGLHISVKNRLDDLKKFCKHQILKNYGAVMITEN